MHATLNRAYKLIWSHVQATWVVVSEIARGQGKAKSTRLLSTLASLVIASSLPQAWAAPTGGTVTGGEGSISQTSTVTTIQQHSPTLNLQWNTFNVATNEIVNFIQPSSSALAINQILDTNGSRILGHINANGQVWLINPNGVYFGQGAQVNVGALLASTLNPLGTPSTNGKQTFGNGGQGSIVNEGSIQAANGGYVALLSNSVSNRGSIQANQGAVALGAGSQVSVTFADNHLLALNVDQSVINSLAENKGLIQANGGLALLSAGAKDSLLASVVNNEGIIEAKTVNHTPGKIILMGGMAAGTTQLSGKLDASAEQGDGGFIETSAAKVKVADSASIITRAYNQDQGTGKSGQWLIDPYDFTVAFSGGDITGAALSAALSTGDVTIETQATKVVCTAADCGSGNSTGNGDIVINDRVNAPNTPYKLTLNAYRDININKAMKVGALTASAGRDVNVNAVVDVKNTLQVDVAKTDASGHLNMQLNTDGFIGKINLDPLVKSVQINGATYQVITNATQLASVTGAQNFVLANDISLSSIPNWAPIANFTGAVEGLGHVVSDLTINDSTTDNVGLFGQLGDASTMAEVSNLGITGAIKLVSPSFVNGLDLRNIGGLAGASSGTGADIHNVYTNVSISLKGSSYGGSLGGLIGVGDAAQLRNVYAKGAITALAENILNIGGLIGSSNAIEVNNAFASGNMSANSGESRVGGLIGRLDGSATVQKAYASGTVYGAGSGKGISGIGGLIGVIDSIDSLTLDNVYANGQVSSLPANKNKMGGLIGNITNPTTTLSDAYYATSTLQTAAYGSASATPETTNVAQITESKNNKQDSYPYLDTHAWVIKNGVPSLSVFSTPASISLNYALNPLTGTFTYKGAAYQLADFWSPSTVFGSADYSGWTAGVDYVFIVNGKPATGVTNAGTYAISVEVLKDGYSIANTGNTSGSLIIAQKDLTVIASQTSKTYDGTVKAPGSGTVGALVGKDSVSNAGSQTYVDKNAGGGNKVVKVSGVTIKDADGADTTANYKISYVDNTTSTIEKATLTYVVNSVVTNVGETPAVTGYVTGFVNGDSYSSEFNQQNAQWIITNAYTNTPGTYSVIGAGLTSNNYTFVQASTNKSAIVVILNVPNDGSMNAINATRYMATAKTQPASQQLQNDSLFYQGVAVATDADRIGAFSVRYVDSALTSTKQNNQLINGDLPIETSDSSIDANERGGVNALEGRNKQNKENRLNLSQEYADDSHQAENANDDRGNDADLEKINQVQGTKKHGNMRINDWQLVVDRGGVNTGKVLSIRAN